MDKPLSIQVEEFKANIIKLINDSKLPALVAKPIIKDLYEQLTVQEQMQYKKDVEQYHKAMKEKEVENNGIHKENVD